MRSKIKRKKKRTASEAKTSSEAASGTSGSAEAIVVQHSAVLGLCAFVNAFPYDVPEFVPDILMTLSDHLHDPQPIPVSSARPLLTVLSFEHLFWL